MISLNPCDVIVSAVGRLEEEARVEPLEVESNARPVDQKAEVRIQDLKKVLPFDSCSVQLLNVLSHNKIET